MSQIVKLSTKSFNQIIDFVEEKNDRIQGSRLNALYNLIQKKGILISGCEQDSALIGTKALRISETQYVSFLHYPIFKNKFYPCKTKVSILIINN